ncbi:MAG: ParA family protein [Syntrophales bacterium]
MNNNVVAIINQKGGVGKTTTSINLGHGLAILGKKVLLIDLDPQAHSTIVLAPNRLPFALTIQDVLIDRKDIRDAIIRTSIANLDLVPSHIHLDRAEHLLIPEMFRETRLSQALAGMDYDFILIDCRPTLGILSINALYSCGTVLIPCETARFSLEGFADLLNTVKVLKRGKDDSEQLLLRILLCKFDPRKAISNDWVLKQLETHKMLLFKTRVRQCEALNQAHIAKESIFIFKPNSHGAEDYMNLGKEFLELCIPSEKN